MDTSQAAKKRDGHVNCINSKLENISGSTIERLESYDKKRTDYDILK